jgi:magnesium transporter
VISIAADADQEEAARTLARYGLLVLPTVDDEGRLVGVITADDVIDVLQEEATEDIYRLGGLSSEETVDQSVLTTSRQRLTWLAVNLPTALLAGTVVSIFEGTVARVAVLAVFMPIIAGMGGNAGIQTLTLIVRSIALGEISLRDSWRTLGREVLVGLVNGVCFGLLVGAVGWLWKGIPILGLIAGVAMLANMLAAAIAGTVVPLVLRRFGADPALASGVIVTTFTDVTGYTAFLGLATLLISRFPT